jgi:hypothetical protein
MKRPLAKFSGRFRDNGTQVILEGVFHIPFGVKFQCSFLLALLALVAILSGYSLISEHDQQAVLGLIISLGIAAASIFNLKLKTEDIPSDWKWLASSIKDALRV